MTTVEADVGFDGGRALRKVVPRSAHAEWAPQSKRPDPVRLLEEQNATRLPWLVPVRHARMVVSPFTFYRGAARIMACDLATTPNTGLTVQLGGDAHLSNFGAYASPERQLVFDANDFDETLPGPWEWDLKRLATSVMIAGQHLGLSKKEQRRATSDVTRAYRRALGEFAEMGHFELWQHYVSVDDVQKVSGLDADEMDRRLERFEKRARKKTSLRALKKLAVNVYGRYQIRSDPPLLVPLRDLPEEYEVQEVEAAVLNAFEEYKESLRDNLRRLVDRYTLVDFALKVVGVGSVGTRAVVLLLQGQNDNDPLFLQAKEAGSSVLEEYLPPSQYEHGGRRVVEGQRLVQAQSDIFLGWTTGQGPDKPDFYIRQLRDWKGSPDVEAASPGQLGFYAGLCGHTLARGHARSGDPAAIHGYAGKGLDDDITEFAEAYSAQNLEDYERFRTAIDDGHLETARLEDL